MIRAGEQLIPLNQARNHLPGRPSLPSLHRFATSGGRGGAVLATIVCGHRRYTSIEACQRFLADCTAASERESEPGASPQPIRQKRRESRIQVDELVRRGVLSK